MILLNTFGQWNPFWWAWWGKTITLSSQNASNRPKMANKGKTQKYAFFGKTSIRRHVTKWAVEIVPRQVDEHQRYVTCSTTFRLSKNIYCVHFASILAPHNCAWKVQLSAKNGLLDPFFGEKKKFFKKIQTSVLHRKLILEDRNTSDWHSRDSWDVFWCLGHASMTKTKHFRAVFHQRRKWKKSRGNNFFGHQGVFSVIFWCEWQKVN